MARWFAHAGAAVCAIVGTSAQTLGEACRTLNNRYGILPRGYASVDEALEKERPDILAVCSPYEHHREHLEAALKAGVHCLCEKPMWWAPAAVDAPADARRSETIRLVDAFLERNLHLALITQWPLTLSSFYELYPELEGEPTRTFELLLSPISTGQDMVLDAAPHGLSLLQKLLGSGDVLSPKAEYADGDRKKLRLEFCYDARRGEDPTTVVFRFETSPAPPRPASYAINGREMRRRIRLPSYEIHFESDVRSVTSEDPLKLLVNDFLAAIETGAPVDRQALIESISGLEVLHAAAD